MDMQCPESADYAETLTEALGLLERISVEYAADNWTRAHDLTAEIAKLYAPRDEISATMLKTLLEFTFRRAWFDGVHNQIERQFFS